ncbi:MAG TPA: cyclase family protein [Gemmatimonadaceae bacterium]|nr:cyclase family protein [Gemmatimonadaceae bacterium]
MSDAWRDISIALAPGAPEWPGDTPYSCRWTQELARGDTVNLSAITTSPHVGTHADAPRHVHDGWSASDDLPLDVFAGPAVVCSFERVDTLPHVRIERLLLRTGFSTAAGAFPPDWPVLSVRHVDALLARGLKLLGVDAPSVDARHSTGLEVHHALFGGGAYNLENLDLRDVPDGAYDLIALPIKVVGLDAAPVRAVLRAAPARP